MESQPVGIRLGYRRLEAAHGGEEDKQLSDAEIIELSDWLDIRADRARIRRRVRRFKLPMANPVRLYFGLEADGVGLLPDLARRAVAKTLG